MTRVYSAQVLALVENMRNVLKMHNIESNITNQYLSSAVGEIPPLEAWPQLWVSNRDCKRAKTIIEDAGKEQFESEVSICRKCGEEVESQFAVCWNCGAKMD